MARLPSNLYICALTSSKPTNMSLVRRLARATSQHVLHNKHAVPSPTRHLSYCTFDRQSVGSLVKSPRVNKYLLSVRHRNPTQIRPRLLHSSPFPQNLFSRLPHTALTLNCPTFPNAHSSPQMHCSTKADGEPDGAYIAAVGFKTGADNYEKGRPSYTAEAVDYVVSEVAAVAKSRPESTGTTKYNVVELGAGTGKLTEVLCKKLPESCRYLALEPSQEFHDTMAAKNLGVDTVVGDAGAIPVEDGSAENVVCAQSFHWFADKEYLEEIRRVLVPGGRLMIVMNWKLFERDWMKPIYEQRKKVYARTGSSLKFLINSKQWQRDIKDSPLFSFKEHLSLPGIEFRGDVEKILQNLTTTSAYNMLPKEEQEAYLNELRQILRSWPGLDLNDLSIPFSSEIYTYIAQ